AKSGCAAMSTVAPGNKLGQVQIRLSLPCRVTQCGGWNDLEWLTCPRPWAGPAVGPQADARLGPSLTGWSALPRLAMHSRPADPPSRSDDSAHSAFHRLA